MFCVVNNKSAYSLSPPVKLLPNCPIDNSVAFIKSIIRFYISFKNQQVQCDTFKHYSKTHR